MLIRRVLLIMGLLVLTATPASAQAPPLSDGLNFSVGLAADPIPVRAGQVVTKNVQITNGSNTAGEFAVSAISVDVGDEGVVTPAEQRSDEILKSVSVVPRVSVEPGATAEVPITIAAPETLDPDIYFVGILVQPASVAPNAGGQITINRLLNVLAIDVFGAQERGVEVGFPGHTWFHIGRIDDKYTVTNRNAGVSVSRSVKLDGAFIEDDLGGSKTEDPQRTSLDTIARGHKKTFGYSYKGGLFSLDIVKPLVSVTFSDAGTERTITESGPKSLVVSPLVLALIASVAGSLLVVVVFLVRRRRRVKNDGNVETKDGSTAD